MLQQWHQKSPEMIGKIVRSFQGMNQHKECQLSGKVISIIDGDTLTVLDTHNKEKHKIRLEGVDAPEPRQPFAKKAKKYLSALVKNKTVCINWHKQDKFGRKMPRYSLMEWI